MGRKIPGKKHRGIKDPYAQHAKRLASIKAKTNKAPINLDDQPVPKTLTRLLNWKNKDKSELKKKGEKRPVGLKKVVKRHDLNKNRSSNPVAKLKKISGESHKSFNMRINEAMKSLKHEKGFDDIQDERALEPKERKNDEDGNRIFINRKGKKRRPATADEPFLTKSQKRTQKEKLKKEKLKEEKELDKQYIVRKDDIKFGEIVHEPPTLKIKPRKAEKTTGVPRPARKDLLLNKLFDKTQSTTSTNKSMKTNITTYPKKIEGIINLKGKRRDLPDNVRRKLEQSQKEAIEAYKMIKQEMMRKKSAD